MNIWWESPIFANEYLMYNVGNLEWIAESFANLMEKRMEILCQCLANLFRCLCRCLRLWYSRIYIIPSNEKWSVKCMKSQVSQSENFEFVMKKLENQLDWLSMTVFARILIQNIYRNDMQVSISESGKLSNQSQAQTRSIQRKTGKLKVWTMPSLTPSNRTMTNQTTPPVEKVSILAKSRDNGGCRGIMKFFYVRRMAKTTEPERK